MKRIYLLRSWILTLSLLTLVILISPAETASEMIFTIFLLLIVLKIIPEDREYLIKPVILFSAFYWFSNMLSGRLGAVLSFSGIGLIFIVTICLVERKEGVDVRSKSSG